MSLLDQGSKQEGPKKPACWRMKEQLESCILESDCVRKVVHVSWCITEIAIPCGANLSLSCAM